jgi:MFS family permease
LLVMIFWSVASASHGLAGNDGLAPVFGMSFALVMLVASRCLLGMGEGGGFPAATRVVAEWFPANERASAMGLINAGAAVGAVVAPWLIWLVLNHTGWFGLAFFGQQTWSTLVVILPTDLISKRAVGALAGLVGFGGAMGGVLPGQTIGWMRDHGYSYTPALVLSGSMLVAAFILIRDYPLTASNCVRPRRVRARGLQTRCRPGPLTRRLPMRIRYLPSRDNPVLICLVMPKNQPLNCFANQ